MFTRFVCLANSHKEGGRCLAGIELDSKDNHFFENGRRKWIRPICPHTPHGEIPTPLVSNINLLDIVEIEVTGHPEKNYQSENVFFNESSIKTSGSFLNNKLNNLCENVPTIFRNKGKAVSQEAIASLSHSLLFVKTNQFEIATKTYPDKPDKKQTRLLFSYNGNPYDFPVTDPAFLESHKTNPDVLKNIDEVFLCLSLGIMWQDWYYKLVASIITNPKS